jgi:choline-sulfatase
MSEITRRTLLQGGALLAASGAWREAGTRAEAGPAVRRRLPRRPNFVILFTDEQRATQHWPAGWAQEHLPSENRLKRHGLSFRNCYTAATQCAPSRASFLTSTYPTVNGVTDSLIYPLQSFQQNLARLLRGWNYTVAYKGKWHLSLPVRVGTPGACDPPPPVTAWSEFDIANLAKRYGVPKWNPPDAGNSESDIATMGGGTANNDGRIMRGTTAGAIGQTRGFGESVLDFLARQRRARRPFCLFVSLVNPHDVGAFPVLYEQAGYARADFTGLGIPLPGNFADSLATKPKIQSIFRSHLASAAPLLAAQDKLDYVNFYAYLHTVVDRHIVDLLDALDEHDLTRDTIVFRFADHGEMGLSHGLRQKAYSAYEEATRVPFIVSNPSLFPRALETDALASLIDLLPTVARLIGVPNSLLDVHGFKGRDLGPVLRNPEASVQDSILFSFDDSFPGVAPGGAPDQIRSLRKGPWKYAVYFTRDGSAFDHELYNLDDDPGELVNLAPGGVGITPPLEAERQFLHRALAQKMVDVDALPPGFSWPAS